MSEVAIGLHEEMTTKNITCVHEKIKTWKSAVDYFNLSIMGKHNLEVPCKHHLTSQALVECQEELRPMAK